MEFLYIILSYFLGKFFNIIFSSVDYIVFKGIKLEHLTPFYISINFKEMLLILGISIVSLLIILRKECIKRKMIKSLLFFELYFFSFSFGTTSNKELFFVIFILFLMFFLFFNSFENLFKESKKEVETLYKSREKFLSIIDFYLSNMKSFSIIGNWGIGKTKLIENFFYGDYKDNKEKYYFEKYEFIYIDTSIYSENKKIIEVLEKEIKVLLKKYKFLSMDIKFVKEIFLEENMFAKIISKIFFCDIFLENSKKELEEKIKTISKEKKIVICLDNIERSNDKNRIVELFAILDEILPQEIKRIYVYDEKQMIKIFEKDNEDFVDYISKYVFNKIRVDGIKLEEVLPDRENLVREIKKIKDKVSNGRNLIEKSINKEFESYSNGEEIIKTLKEKVEQYFKEILEKLNSPRYLVNLKEYLGVDEERLEYKVEYKIIRDFFSNLELEDILDENIGIDGIFHVDKYRQKDESSGKYFLRDIPLKAVDIEKLIQKYIFEINKRIETREERNNYQFATAYFGEKQIYFESYYKNIPLEETKPRKELERYKKNPEKYLFEIIGTLEFYGEQGLIKLNEYIENKEFTYFINDYKGFSKVYNLDDKILKIILKRIKINKNGNYKEKHGNYKAQEWAEIFLKVYIRDSKEIKSLIQFLLTEDKAKEYFKIRECSVNDEFDRFFKEEFGVEKIRELYDFLKEKLEENINDLENIGLNVLDIKLSLEVFKELCNIEVISTKINFYKKISEEILKSDSIIEKIKREDNKLIIENIYRENEIEVKPDNVDFYLKELTEEKEKELYDDIKIQNIDTLKIELYKFKNKK